MKKIIFIITIVFMSLGNTNLAFGQAVTIDTSNLVPNTIQSVNTSGTFALDLKDAATELLKNAAKRLAEKSLSKITESTVNWINSGMPNGGPLFVQDPKGYFSNLTNESIVMVVNDLQTTSKSVQPYAKDIAVSIVKSRKNQNSNISTLDSAIKNSVKDGGSNDEYGGEGKGLGDGSSLESSSGTENIEKFNNDFTYGGWNGWLALTQNDSNNIIGSTFKEVDKLAYGNAKKEAQVKEELAQGDGFLPITECEDSDYQDPTNFPAPTEEEYTTTKTDDDGNAITVFNREAYNQAHRQWQAQTTCDKMATKTPGKLSAESITQVLGSKVRLGEYSQTFGTSLSAILDSLVNHFMNKGLSSLSGGNGGGLGKSIGGAENDTFVYDGKTISLGQTISDDWRDTPDEVVDLYTLLQGQMQADGTRDKNTSVIEYMRAYVGIMGKELYEYGNLPEKIQKLDSCIPGPDMGWENRLRDEVLNERSELAGYSGYGDEDKEEKLNNIDKYLPQVIRDIKIKKIGTIAEDWPMKFFYDYTDTVNASKKMGINVVLLTDKYSSARAVLVRLEALKSKLDTKPSTAELQELVKKYLLLKNQIPDESTVNDERGDLEKVYAYSDELKEQTVKCIAESAGFKPFYKNNVLGSVDSNGSACSRYDGKTVGINPIPNPDGTVSYLPANTYDSCVYSYFCEVPFNYATPYQFQGNGLGYKGSSPFPGSTSWSPFETWEQTFYADCEYIYDADIEEYSMEKIR